MKYCVNCRQPKDVLEKVDEIFVEERDYRIVPELFVKYPNKTIILDYRKHSFDLQTLKDYAEASEDFVVKVYNLADNEKSNRFEFLVYKALAKEMISISKAEYFLNIPQANISSQLNFI